jgi:hypothetical protein
MPIATPVAVSVPLARVPVIVRNDNAGPRGPTLGERVLARQAELELRLEQLPPRSTESIAIATALATLHQYLSADLDHLSAGTAFHLSLWLERNKYLGR